MIYLLGAVLAGSIGLALLVLAICDIISQTRSS